MGVCAFFFFIVSADIKKAILQITIKNFKAMNPKVEEFTINIKNYYQI